MGNLFSPNLMQDIKAQTNSSHPRCQVSLLVIDSIIYHIYNYEMFSLCVNFVDK